MKILFLSYWGVHEGLSSATVLPHLKILASFDGIAQVVFCSIERSAEPVAPVSIGEKILHVPLHSRPGSSLLLTKFKDFYTFPRQLEILCKQVGIDIILCRSSLGGALGYLLSRRTKIPYVVESFEPHTDYMIDAGVWPKRDPRVFIGRYFEKKIKATASALLPVSFHYEKKLIAEGIDPTCIILLPCCVPLESFSFKPQARAKIRSGYGIADDVRVGVYAGKFGGIYYDEEAFQLYRQAFEVFGNQFFLLLLTADPPGHLRKRIAQYDLPADRVLIKNVPHHEVADYLSAADFAFSTRKPSPFRKYCSPIKDGEYWANGLPILVEEDIGDDGEIVKREGGGFILDMAAPQAALLEMKASLTQGRVQLAMPIRQLAFQYRRMALAKDAYNRLLRL